MSDSDLRGIANYSMPAPAVAPAGVGSLQQVEEENTLRCWRVVRVRSVGMIDQPLLGSTAIDHARHNVTGLACAVGRHV